MINWPIEQPTLSDGQVTLRPLREDDIEAVLAACQDPLISAFTPVPYPYDLEMAEEFVRGAALGYLNHQSITFAIESEGKLAGTIALHSLSIANHCAEVGYWMSADHRGKGICTSALKIISKLALEVMAFRRVQGLADDDNFASHKVLERAGYKREAQLAQRVTKSDGTQRDMLLYAIVQ
jgi:RimJ/RimL family protein N-acetyltransferase